MNTTLAIHNVTTIVSEKIKHMGGNEERAAFWYRHIIFKTEDGEVDVTAFSDTREGLTTS